MARAGLARLLRTLAFVVVIPALPALVFTVVGFQDASMVWSLGAMTGLFVALAADVRVAAVVALALAAATAVADLVADLPWAAALLMAVCAGLTGLASARGLSGGLLMAPITVAFMVSEPPDFLPQQPEHVGALVAGLVMLLAALWGLAVGTVLGRSVHLPPVPPVAVRRAVSYAVEVGVVVGTAAWFVSAWQLRHGGAWLLMTLLIVIQPYLGDTWTRSLQRAGGTVVGFVVAFVLGLMVPWPGVAFALGIAFMVGSLALRLRPGHPYWQYVAVLTPAVVLMEGSQGSVVDTDIQRMTFTLIGAGVAVLVMGLLIPFHRRDDPWHAPATHPGPEAAKG